MASETQSGGTFANDAAVGTIDWTNPSNAQTSDNSYADASIGSNLNTKYLKASNFGFTIPIGATIDGIKVRIEKSVRYTTPPKVNIDDNSVRLYYKDAWRGDDKADASYWATSDTYEEYGGDSDDWGLAPIEAEFINDSGFGVGISGHGVIDGELPANTAWIDHIEIIVYYTEAGGGAKIQQSIVIT